MSDSIIGAGERITLRILYEMFPDAILERQVKLIELLSKDFVEDIGQRAKKETIDIVVFRPKPLIVRVQDDRHKTHAMGVIDMRQKWELEESNCDVVDIWKSDCPAVFKEKNLIKARNEIKKVLEDQL